MVLSHNCRSSCFIGRIERNFDILCTTSDFCGCIVLFVSIVSSFIIIIIIIITVLHCAIYTANICAFLLRSLACKVWFDLNIPYRLTEDIRRRDYLKMTLSSIANLNY